VELRIATLCYLNILLEVGISFRYNIQDLQGQQSQVNGKLSYNLETIAGRYCHGIDNCWATAC
jgi:hypothetical protein